ncbi:Proteasome activator pa28, N-terminal domain,Proteasome activator pa28, C-terminal [Cinara cedri]|uniref:Proteasome activator pa28, N-terminal domain,Proteasome activator pa28, C-terminal n=1 Tax=Cinara cedri TaxID=506608 RepID=A0A5E4NR50_9HEMI|nr:Proteasome activator pa28, N-terminal domain,Proteasome activator pa28, C-terminal [Cinara cedri]
MQDNQAENRVVQKFPERIVYLNELLKKPEFCLSEINLKCNLELPTEFQLGINVKNCDEKNPRKSLDSKQPFIPSNKNVTEAFKIIKPNIQQLIEDTNALKMWVSLLIPKIEDGNNFGVFIQEGTLVQILQVENEATSYLKHATQYYAARGKLITKVVKYPYVEDYKLAIDELDKKTYVSIAIVMHDIRNHYTTLYDIVIKNIDKIKKPRSSNTTSFY